ncbi:hypothetical protein LSH36_573g05028, partial [Paralvinella palmiformis]
MLYHLEDIMSQKLKFTRPKILLLGAEGVGKTGKCVVMVLNVSNRCVVMVLNVSNRCVVMMLNVSNRCGGG